MLVNYLNTLKCLGYEYIDEINLKEQVKLDLPADINKLREVVLNCNLCNLSKVRNNVVFDNGTNKAEIFFVGLSPSVTNDSNGNILSGISGKMLRDIILNILEIPLNKIYITNLLKCFIQDKSYLDIALKKCMPYFYNQLDIIKPKIVVVLGLDTYNYIINDNTDENFGKIIKYKDNFIISTYSPLFLVKNPSYKKEALNHFLKIKSFLKEYS